MEPIIPMSHHKEGVAGKNILAWLPNIWPIFCDLFVWIPREIVQLTIVFEFGGLYFHVKYTTYLILVISFTQAGLSNYKFYTLKYLKFTPKRVKYIVFCVQSGRFYTLQFFTRALPMVPVTNQHCLFQQAKPAAGENEHMRIRMKILLKCSSTLPCVLICICICVCNICCICVCVCACICVCICVCVCICICWRWGRGWKYCRSAGQRFLVFESVFVLVFATYVVFVCVSVPAYMCLYFYLFLLKMKTRMKVLSECRSTLLFFGSAVTHSHCELCTKQYQVL